MRTQTDSSDEEADDVDHDEDSHSQMKMEKLSRLKEGVHSSMLSLYKALKSSHVRSGDVTRPSLIQDNCQNCYQGRQALSVQYVAQDSFYRGFLCPKIKQVRSRSIKDVSYVTVSFELL